MAAPSVGRRSCAGQRKAAVHFSKPPQSRLGVLKGLLYDGFFSFAVVRQHILIFFFS